MAGEANQIGKVLRRGLRKRCPRCGEDPVFQRWHEVKPACTACGLEFQSRESNCWGFMYLSTAAITGIFFVVMLIYRPPSLFLRRTALFFLGLALLTASLPYRKSVALALDFLIDPDPKKPVSESGHPRQH